MCKDKSNAIIIHSLFKYSLFDFNGHLIVDRVFGGGILGPFASGVKRRHHRQRRVPEMDTVGYREGTMRNAHTQIAWLQTPMHPLKSHSIREFMNGNAKEFHEKWIGVKKT